MEAPRACRPEELEAVVKLTNICFRAEQGDMGIEYPVLFHPDNCADLTIITDQGTPVSHIGVIRQTIRIEGVELEAASVGAVCTHPDYRMKGLAGKILEYCTHHFREIGTDIFVVSGGRPLYIRSGCEPAAKALNYKLKPDDAKRLVDGRFELVPYTDELFDVVTAFYHSQAVCYHRPHARFKRFLDGAVGHRGQRIFCVRDASGAMVAYLATAGNSFLEWGGSARAVAACLFPVMQAQNLSEMGIYLAEYEAGLRTSFKDAGLTPEPYAYSGTIKVLDLARIGRKLSPRISERLSPREAAGLKLADVEEGFAIEAAGERALITDRNAMARVIFSPHTDWPGNLPDGLRAVLQKFLPLPLPRPGFSYN